MLLDAEKVMTLIGYAEQYATSRNLDVESYVAGLLDVNKMTTVDVCKHIETLINYHKEWLRKSNT